MGNSGGKRKPGSRAPAAPHPLEPFTKPTGLYDSCSWPDAQIKQLIYSKSIAPRYQGTETRLERTEECPICFLYYPGGLNRAQCCDKPICTECFLQLKPPNGSVVCPYCNQPNFQAAWQPFNNEKQILEDIEEQKTIEAKIFSGQRPRDFDEDKDVSEMYGSPEDRKKLQEELHRQSEHASQDRARLQSRGRDFMEAHLETTSDAQAPRRSEHESSLIDAFRSSFGSNLTEAEIEEIMMANAIAASMRESSEARDPGPQQQQQQQQRTDDSLRTNEAGPSEGAVVEARFAAGSDYYRGTITKARSDGTFDIHYDDGDFEEGVPPDLIRMHADDRGPSGQRRGSYEQETALTREDVDTRARGEYLFDDQRGSGDRYRGPPPHSNPRNRWDDDSGRGARDVLQHGQQLQSHRRVRRDYDREPSRRQVGQGHDRDRGRDRGRNHARHREEHWQSRLPPDGGERRGQGHDHRHGGRPRYSEDLPDRHRDRDRERRRGNEGGSANRHREHRRRDEGGSANQTSRRSSSGRYPRGGRPQQSHEIMDGGPKTEAELEDEMVKLAIALSLEEQKQSPVEPKGQATEQMTASNVETSISSSSGNPSPVRKGRSRSSKDKIRLREDAAHRWHIAAQQESSFSAEQLSDQMSEPNSTRGPGGQRVNRDASESPPLDSECLPFDLELDDTVDAVSDTRCKEDRRFVENPLRLPSDPPAEYEREREYAMAAAEMRMHRSEKPNKGKLNPNSQPINQPDCLQEAALLDDHGKGTKFEDCEGSILDESSDVNPNHFSVSNDQGGSSTQPADPFAHLDFALSSGHQSEQNKNGMVVAPAPALLPDPFSDFEAGPAQGPNLKSLDPFSSLSSSSPKDSPQVIPTSRTTPGFLDDPFEGASTASSKPFSSGNDLLATAQEPLNKDLLPPRPPDTLPAQAPSSSSPRETSNPFDPFEPPLPSGKGQEICDLDDILFNVDVNAGRPVDDPDVLSGENAHFLSGLIELDQDISSRVDAEDSATGPTVSLSSGPCTGSEVKEPGASVSLQPSDGPSTELAVDPPKSALSSNTRSLPPCPTVALYHLKP